MLYAFNGISPIVIGAGQFIAPNAAVVGNVTLEDDVSVWFSATVRGDAEAITLKAGCNIQDGAVVHADAGFPCEIGERVTVGHLAMIHGCKIEADSLIGIHATILNGAHIGRGCIIGAGALVTEGLVIPDFSLVLGTPAKVVKQLPVETVELIKAGASHYVDNAAAFNKTLEALI